MNTTANNNPQQEQTQTSKNSLNDIFHALRTPSQKRQKDFVGGKPASVDGSTSKLSTIHNTDSDMELFVAYQTTKKFDENGDLISSDKALRNKLAVRNARLVTFVVSRFYGKHRRLASIKQDLIQEGNFGLLDAIDGFKPELGYKFSTYATWWIRQAINRYLLSDDPLITVPAHVRSASNKIKDTMAANQLDKMSDVTPEMIKQLGLTENMFDAVCASEMVRHYRTVSLDLDPNTSQSQSNRNAATSVTARKISAWGATSYLCVDGRTSMDDAVQDSHTDTLMLRALADLSDRELYVVLLRYGIAPDKFVHALRAKYGAQQS